MILYTLKCKNGHSFDSWFASSNTFDKLKKIGELKCEICGCIDVEKQMMAPKLNSNHKNRAPVEKNMLTKAHSEAEKIFKEFKKKIEKIQKTLVVILPKSPVKFTQENLLSAQ